MSVRARRPSTLNGQHRGQPGGAGLLVVNRDGRGWRSMNPAGHRHAGRRRRRGRLDLPPVMPSAALGSSGADRAVPRQREPVVAAHGALPQRVVARSTQLRRHGVALGGRDDARAA